MKKLLLMMIFCLFIKLSPAQTSFTADNLVVYRYGDGGAALAANTVPLFLDEYQTTAATAGTAVKAQTINVPNTTEGQRLVGLPRGATNYQLEGFAALSPNGTYLTIMGHDQVTGSAATSTRPKTIGRIGVNGIINISTSIPATESASASPRSAVTNDGTGYWIAPPTAGTGVRYITNGGSSSTIVATTPTGVRNLYIFGEQLYAASGSNSFYTIGTGLPATPAAPTPSAVVTVLPGLGNNSQMVFFDMDAAIAGPDLLYVVDDVNGTDAGYLTARLRKYKRNGTSWDAAGSVLVPTLKSITGTINENDITLYGTTWGTATGTIKSSLLKFVDAAAATSNIDALTSFVLAEAPTNTQFRSVTFTPGTAIKTTLPIKLISFVPKVQAQGVLLEWATASETDNAYFEVLSSTDGKTFKKISEVKGSGTVNTAKYYSFLDKNPAFGVNYYKLKQFDLDGKSSESAIVSANFLIGKSEFFISQIDANKLNINVQSGRKESAILRITNLAGQVVYSSKLMLEKGNNSIDINKSFAGTGVFVATLSQQEAISTLKFLIK